MAQFWQRQKIYAQVTALGPLGGRWRSHHVRPRLRQIAPRNYAKQFRALHAREPAQESIRPSWPITATADIESNLFSPCVRRTCYEPLVSTLTRRALPAVQGL